MPAGEYYFVPFYTVDDLLVSLNPIFAGKYWYNITVIKLFAVCVNNLF